MPSFDAVSEVDKHELTNAYDQAVRELGTRFDFKGTKARFERTDNVITLLAESEFQLRQMLEILQGKCAKRGIDIDCMEAGEVSSKRRREPSTDHGTRGYRQGSRPAHRQAGQGQQAQGAGADPAGPVCA